MDVAQIGEGFWRWTAPHGEWASGKDWGEMVGCVYHEPPIDAGESIALIDPQVPPRGSEDEKRFWRHLDQVVERSGLPVAIVVCNRYHGRSTREIYQRYAGRCGATVHAPRGVEGLLACTPTHTFAEGESLPGGLMPYFVEGLVEPEVAIHIPAHDALVFADALLGADGGKVRLPPASWAADSDEDAAAAQEARARYRARFHNSMRRLLDLDFDRLIVSHGEPVLDGGKLALNEALDAPARDDD